MQEARSVAVALSSVSTIMLNIALPHLDFRAEHTDHCNDSSATPSRDSAALPKSEGTLGNTLVK